MLVRALTSFAGNLSMYEGEEKEVADGKLVQDLLRAGYIEIAVQEAEVVEKPVEKSEAFPVKATKTKKSKR